jgi:hypothetical protein
MKKNESRGVSSIEFAFSMMVLVPLLLGTGVIGINMIRNLQTIQLARDAGHMYARGTDFSQPGNQTLLASLGGNLGLSATPGSGNAVVILSALTYIDKNACSTQGLVDSSGNPTGACTNYTYWVFKQRVQVGKGSIRGSNFGSPITSGPSGVTCTPSPTNCSISKSDQATKIGARAVFSGVNPYSVSAGGAVSGLPSGQALYLAEASALGFNMPPFVSNMVSYSFAFF